MALILSFVFLIALIVGLVLVVYGTMRKTKWGVNAAANVCPRCGTQLPRVRKPRNARQAMWGGSTCNNCAAELDKWGREIA